MRRYRYYPLLLTTFAAATVAWAQPSPSEEPAKPSTSERVGPSDPGLALEVQARLYQEMPNSSLSVLVRYSVATLNGNVRTDADRQRAESIALFQARRIPESRLKSQNASLSRMMSKASVPRSGNTR